MGEQCKHRFEHWVNGPLFQRVRFGVIEKEPHPLLAPFARSPRDWILLREEWGNNFQVCRVCRISYRFFNFSGASFRAKYPAEGCGGFILVFLFKRSKEGEWHFFSNQADLIGCYFFFLNSKHWLSITIFGLFLSTCQRNEIRSRNCVSHSPGLWFQNHGKTNIDYSVAKHENSCKMQVQRSHLFLCPLFKEIPCALILINRIFCCCSFCFFDTGLLCSVTHRDSPASVYRGLGTKACATPTESAPSLHLLNSGGMNDA